MRDDGLSQPYRWWKFAWACLKWAFLRWERGEALGSLAGTNLVTATSWLTGAGAFFAFPLGQAELGVVSLGIVVLLAGAVAPYHLWKAERIKLDGLSEPKGPGLDVKVVIQEAGGPHGNRHCCIAHLTNVGSGTVEECHLTVRDVEVLINHHWTETGLEPFRLEWPANLNPDGVSLTFHDHAHAKLFHRPTRGTSALYFFDAHPNRSTREGYEHPPRVQVAEHPRTRFLLDVAARNSLRWLGRIEIEVDPVDAVADKYLPGSGGVEWGDEVQLELVRVHEIKGGEDAPEG